MLLYDVSIQSVELANTERWRFHNGGILRGMTPRASWNRLVNALEGWNQIETEQLKLQKEQEERRNSSSETTATESSSESPSKSDATSQADFQQVPPPISSPPNRITSTEVFIPSSTSIKCLTWKQEEVHPPPREDTLKITPPTTPIKMNAKSILLLPMQYPVPQHLDHASRISERIHRSFAGLPLAQNVHPLSVPDLLEGSGSPLIRHRIPTLVNPKPISPFMEEKTFFESESILSTPCGGFNTCQDFFEVSNNESSSCSFPSLMDISTPETIPIPVLEKIDFEEFPSDGEEIKLPINSRFRLVAKNKAKRRSSLTLQLPPIPSIFSKIEAKKCVTFEDISEGEVSEEEMGGTQDVTYSYYNLQRPRYKSIEEDQVVPSFFSANSPLMSPTWSDCCSTEDSSSSGESWNFSRTLVQVVPDQEDFQFKQESVSEWVKEVSPNVTTVVTVDLKPVEATSSSMFGEEEEEEALSSLEAGCGPPPPTDSADAATDSKFRNHFARELTQMEKIGKQLKQLQQLNHQGARFSLVQPYLQQILELEGCDHSEEDPLVDPHIEECSSWNVETELGLVNNEINSLNKLLKTGITPRRRDSSASGCSTIPSTTSHGSPISPPRMEARIGGGRRPTTAPETRRVSTEFHFPPRNTLSEAVVSSFPQYYDHQPYHLHSEQYRSNMYSNQMPSTSFASSNYLHNNPHENYRSPFEIDNGHNNSFLRYPTPHHHNQMGEGTPRHFDQISSCASFPVDPYSRSNSVFSYGHGDANMKPYDYDGKPEQYYFPPEEPSYYNNRPSAATPTLSNSSNENFPPSSNSSSASIADGAERKYSNTYRRQNN